MPTRWSWPLGCWLANWRAESSAAKPSSRPPGLPGLPGLPRRRPSRCRRPTGLSKVISTTLPGVTRARDPRPRRCRSSTTPTSRRSAEGGGGTRSCSSISPRCLVRRTTPVRTRIRLRTRRDRARTRRGGDAVAPLLTGSGRAVGRRWRHRLPASGAIARVRHGPRHVLHFPGLWQAVHRSGPGPPGQLRRDQHQSRQSPPAVSHASPGQDLRRVAALAGLRTSPTGSRRPVVTTSTIRNRPGADSGPGHTVQGDSPCVSLVTLTP